MVIGEVVATLAANNLNNINRSGKASGLRVLYVIPGIKGDPNNMIFVHRQIASISEHGVRCSTFFLESRTSLLSIIDEIFRFRKTIRECKPDIIHAQYGTVTSLLCAYCSWYPLIIHYRGSDLNSSPNVSTFRAKFQIVFSQLSALRAQGIITVSGQLKNKLWWKRATAIVVPSGIDTNLFKPQPKKIARNKLGWKIDERIVVINGGSGKAQQNKRLELAQQAVTQAEKLVGKIRLEILNGDVPPNMMPWVLNAADCVLLTSLTEGSPNIVKEALACNIPVVSVAVGDVVERLENVYPSFIAEPNPQALGDSIAKTIELSIRSNGRTKIENLSQENVASTIVDFYLSKIIEK